MAGEGEVHGILVTDAIDNEAEEHDADGKRPQPHPGYLTDLCIGQVEFLPPLRKGQGAENKAERGGHKGRKAGPKQFLVRCLLDFIFVWHVVHHHIFNTIEVFKTACKGSSKSRGSFSAFNHSSHIENQLGSAIIFFVAEDKKDNCVSAIYK